MKDSDFFNKYAREKGFYEAYPESEYRRIISATGILKEPRDKKILDAGCGSGAFTFRLAREGFKVSGIDLSKELVKIGRKEGIVELYCGDILKMPFARGSYDIIFSGAILHHIPDKLVKCAEEFFRVLKDNGRVYFFEPYSRCLNSFIWYNILHYERTESEKAINPFQLKKAFFIAGFKKFYWKKLVRVRHNYWKDNSPFTAKILGVLCKLANYSFLPNIFITGYIEK